MSAPDTAPTSAPKIPLALGAVTHGCTTCIGNSGPLPDSAIQAQAAGRLQVAVLSGNRNFPGRVHPQLAAGFLASPPLVVAFALAGDVERDILRDQIAPGVHLADLWPSGAEIDAMRTAGSLPRTVASIR
ncbi:aconitase family protein [Paracoccus yeei]|nr:aconitase family protein [Paracoccus yeei]